MAHSSTERIVRYASIFLVTLQAVVIFLLLRSPSSMPQSGVSRDGLIVRDAAHTMRRLEEDVKWLQEGVQEAMTQLHGVDQQLQDIQLEQRSMKNRIGTETTRPLPQLPQVPQQPQKPQGQQPQVVTTLTEPLAHAPRDSTRSSRSSSPGRQYPYRRDGTIDVVEETEHTPETLAVLSRVPEGHKWRYSSKVTFNVLFLRSSVDSTQYLLYLCVQDFFGGIFVTADTFLLKGLYWTKRDDLFRKFQYYNSSLHLPELPKSVEDRMIAICDRFSQDTTDGRKLCKMFQNAFPNTLATTTQMLHDGTTYVITGDIPLMWMRDSSAQVNQYLSLAPEDPHIQIIVEGLIRRQIKWIHLDPYGSSYRLFLDFDHAGKHELTDWDFKSGRTIHVAMHNYEIDSLCYFVKLSYQYWKTVGEDDIFDEEWKSAVELIIKTWRIEQDHAGKSSYTYPELSNGHGPPVCNTGMTWVGFRPSDDKCKYHFFVPGNMFAVVVLQYISEIASEIYFDEDLEQDALALAEEIDEAIHKHAVVDWPNDPSKGKIYAYETDGCGQYNLMDDANVPSLLSIPYLGYKSKRDPNRVIEQNTRRFILSPANPIFYDGGRNNLRGIGSPHTGQGRIWPMALVMQALTSDSDEEILSCVDMLLRSDGGTNFMHESFTATNPRSYTRSWFAWANSLFSELIIEHIDVISRGYNQ